MHPSLGIATSFAASWFLIASLDFLASSKWRNSARHHWTERARFIFPARRSTSVNLVILTICAVLFGWSCSVGYSFALVLFALAAFIGGILDAFPLERRIFPELNARDWRCQQKGQQRCGESAVPSTDRVSLCSPRKWVNLFRKRAKKGSIPTLASKTPLRSMFP
jgi:hypothetical protein